MDTARYVAAVLMLVTFPPAFIVWLLIHPLVAFWRRLGPKGTYGVLLPLMAVVGAAAYWARRPLLEVEYGASWLAIGLAIPLMVASGVLRYQHRKHLTFRILAGIPELEPGGRAGRGGGQGYRL